MLLFREALGAGELPLKDHNEHLLVTQFVRHVSLGQARG
jgi:hypothetical protein